MKNYKHKILTIVMLMLMTGSMAISSSANATESINYWDYNTFAGKSDIGVPNAAAISSDRLFIAEFNKLRIFKYSHGEPLEFESLTNVGSICNDVLINMTEAFIACSDGIRYYNCQPGSQPVLDGFLQHDGGYRTILLQANSNFYAVELGGGALDVYDYGLSLQSAIETPGTAYDVAVLGPIAYVADGENGLAIYDLTDQTDPIYLGNRPTTYQSIGLKLDAEEDLLYVAANHSGVIIFDISDRENPVQIGVLDTVAQATSVEISNGNALVCDLNHAVSAFDVSDPTQSIYLGTLAGEDNFDVVVGNDFYYFLLEPGSVHQYFTVQKDGFAPWAGELEVSYAIQDMVEANNYVYMANGTHGISIANASGVDHSAIVSTFDTSFAKDVARHNGYLYVADGSAGLKILDVSSISNPVLVGTVDTDGSANGVAIYEGNGYTFAIVADGSRGVAAIDIGNPEEAFLAYSTTEPFTSSTDDVTVIDNIAYFTCTSEVVKVLPAPTNAHRLGFAETTNAKGDVFIRDGKCYVADGSIGLSILNFNWHAVEKSLQLPGVACDIALDGDYAYVATGASGMAAIQLEYPVDIGWASVALNDSRTNCVTASANYAFAGSDNLDFGYRQNMPGPLQITMDGPTRLYAGVNYTWTANVQGGRAPYTYNWTFRLGCSGDGTTIGGKALLEAMFRQDGCLRLTVTSADGQEAVVGRHIILRVLPNIGINRYGLGKSFNDPVSLELELGQNTPNPFNPRTAFNFSLPKDTHVRLDIFDIRGRLVETVADQNFASGRHAIDFDGTHLASGIYYYRLVTNEKTLTKKMTLMK